MGAGRPRRYSDEEVKEIKDALSLYIENTEIPIVAEFAYLHDVHRSTLYDYEEFSSLLKKCIDKKEAQLERQGLANNINATMAIFSLKQLGWRDKQEIEHSGDLDIKVDIID